jgi:hypothetical protein
VQWHQSLAGGKKTLSSETRCRIVWSCLLFGLPVDGLVQTHRGLSLPAVVSKILARSAQPLPARAMAEKVLASGYLTKSKDITNVIWWGVGMMAKVENVAGQDCRLKNGKDSK